MKVVIIEDEIVAAQRLGSLIGQLRPEFEIVATIQTIEESVEWFTLNPRPDLVFMDIHLADGSSFEIFNKIMIQCPIVFTTAYNEYALEAFEVNGIDYLLKPINKDRLGQAITKFEQLIGSGGNNPRMLADLIASLQEKQAGRKTHFLIPHKDKLVPLAVQDIAYIFAELKAARVTTFGGQSYSVDHSLDEMMKQLDEHDFFRVNRQYIVSHQSIADLSVWFGGKLSVNLKVPSEERIIVSKARVSDFKAWFTRDFKTTDDKISRYLIGGSQ